MSGAAMTSKKRPGKGKRAAAGDGGAGDRVRGTAPIQVPADLAKMVGVISKHMGVTQAEVVEPHLRPYVLTVYERVLREMQDAVKQFKQ